MSVRWTILAFLVALVALIGWCALASQRKTMSQAERERDDREQSESMRALLQAADKEVSHRPRVRAGSLPSITTTKGTK